MKSIHYCNIGMAKSGTTALYSWLLRHPRCDYSGLKENYNFSHFDWSVDQYNQFYRDWDFSMNFNPSSWTMDSDQIRRLAPSITHCSIILRNPWDFISSLFAFVDAGRVHTMDSFVDMMLETNQLDYAKIIAHWSRYYQRSILVLYYDDLLSRPQWFLDQVLDLLEIDQLVCPNTRVNVTRKPRADLEISRDRAQHINSLIDSCSDFLDRDLTCWKKIL